MHTSYQVCTRSGAFLMVHLSGPKKKKPYPYSTHASWVCTHTDEPDRWID